MSTKIALTLIVLILLVSTAGCSKEPAASASDNETSQSNYQQTLPITVKGAKLALDASAAGTIQQLSVNDLMTVSLESNPSTGYGWFAKSSDPAVIDQEGEAQYNEPASIQPVVGAAGTQTLTFKAADSGTATITLEYKRGWETDVAPEKILTITVEVK